MRDRDPGEYLVKGNILANLFRGDKHTNDHDL